MRFINPELLRSEWDLDEPQPEVIRLVAEGAVNGAALDVLCGTGENALFLSSEGYPTLGVDVSRELLRIAREKAEVMQVRRGVCARFKPMRPYQLAELDESFQFILDIGQYQFLSESIRPAYLQSLQSVMQLDGRLHLILFDTPQEPVEEACATAKTCFLSAGWQMQTERSSELRTRTRPFPRARLQVYTSAAA